MADEHYLELWQRMQRVVQAYSDAGRVAEADYLMVDFFVSFADRAELEAHVSAAEAAAQEEGLVARA